MVSVVVCQLKTFGTGTGARHGGAAEVSVSRHVGLLLMSAVESVRKFLARKRKQLSNSDPIQFDEKGYPKARAKKASQDGLIIDEQGKPRVRLTPPSTKYWDRRKAAPWYVLTLSLAKMHAPNALTALDVGAADPGYLARLDWIPTKIGLDLHSSEGQRAVWRKARGVNLIVGDFLKVEFAAPFDLVVCNQVVEHLPHGFVEQFVRKMMATARILIVSTTLDLPAGTIDGHIQDPISESEFRSWFDSPHGQIIDFRRGRGGNPDANFTLPNKKLGRSACHPYFFDTKNNQCRVPAWNQAVVWKRTNFTYPKAKAPGRYPWNEG